MIAAALTTFFTVSVFAYAGGIGATVDSFVAKLMAKFSGILLDICDMLVSPIFSITTMSVSEIAAYIPGFNTASGSGAFFVEGIQMLGTCLAGCLAMFGVLKIIIGLARDEKVGSIGSLIWRMFIFIPLTIFGRKLLEGLFDQVITPISSAFASGVLDFSNNAVFSTAAAPLTGNASQLATLIVGTVLMVMIGYNLIGLVLEAAERYIICIVIIFLSPLALATGVSEESSMIAKNWLKMFWSHGVLLILNIWVVGIGRSCFDTLDPSATTTQIIVWALITYAYFKVAQKLDDMMQNSGMMITRTGGDFVHDATLAVGTIAATGKHLFGGAADTVVAGAGVANAIRSGGGVGDVAKPIASYVKSHPILAPTAGAAATVAGGAAGFAAQVGAAHSLSHTSDSARAESVASGKLPNINTPAYRTAAQNILNQNGFAPAKGGTVDGLSVNPNGSLSGVVTQRDATVYVKANDASGQQYIVSGVDPIPVEHGLPDTRMTVKLRAEGTCERVRVFTSDENLGRAQAAWGRGQAILAGEEPAPEHCVILNGSLLDTKWERGEDGRVYLPMTDVAEAYDEQSEFYDVEGWLNVATDLQLQNNMSVALSRMLRPAMFPTSIFRCSTRI